MRTAHLHIDESSYCLFFPQQLSALRPFEKYLRWLPMGGQYLVCASNQSVTPPDRGFRQPGRPSSSLRNVLTAFCAP
jgi:hypothetical protein